MTSEPFQASLQKQRHNLAAQPPPLGPTASPSLCSGSCTLGQCLNHGHQFRSYPVWTKSVPKEFPTPENFLGEHPQKCCFVQKCRRNSSLSSGLKNPVMSLEMFWKLLGAPSMYKTKQTSPRASSSSTAAIHYNSSQTSGNLRGLAKKQIASPLESLSHWIWVELENLHFQAAPHDTETFVWGTAF